MKLIDFRDQASCGDALLFRGCLNHCTGERYCSSVCLDGEAIVRFDRE
ncbi:hypothetical protein [Streptomyces sp. NPDC051662]